MNIKTYSYSVNISVFTISSFTTDSDKIDLIDNKIDKNSEKISNLESRVEKLEKSK